MMLLADSTARLARVHLTDEEIRQAGMSAIENRIRAMALGRHDAYGYDGPGWDLQIEGRLAEQAFAKFTGKYLADSRALDHDGDVGKGVQVRSTRHRPPLLRVNTRDRDDHCFVLAVGQGADWEFPGWTWGREAKLPEFWRTEVCGKRLRAGGFYVPTTHLRPLPSRYFGDQSSRYE